MDERTAANDRACIARPIPGVQLLFPLTEKQAVAVIVAADAFGVEPWEMAAHVLRVREYVLTGDPGDWHRKRPS